MPATVLAVSALEVLICYRLALSACSKIVALRHRVALSDAGGLVLVPLRLDRVVGLCLLAWSLALGLAALLGAGFLGAGVGVSWAAVAGVRVVAWARQRDCSCHGRLSEDFSSAQFRLLSLESALLIIGVGLGVEPLAVGWVGCLIPAGVALWPRIVLSRSGWFGRGRDLQRPASGALDRTTHGDHYAGHSRVA